MTEAGRPIVILGIGNILMQDEGLGVHAVRALLERALPPGVEVVDGGTLGIELLPIVEHADSLILIDAARFSGEPGEVCTFRGDELAGSYGGHVSPHQAGAADLIAVARLTGSLPERCTLFGIQPVAMGFGLELSDTLTSALPSLVEAVLAEALAFAEVPAHA
jgi:hydrogenase maturation protease